MRTKRTQRRHLLAGALAASMALALPAVGQAGTVVKTSGPGAHIVFDAAAGENNRLDIYEQGGFVYVTDIGAATTAGSGCEQLGSNARCSTAGLVALDVAARDGDNQASVNVTYDTVLTGAGATHNSFFGGLGDDQIYGASGADELLGRAGDDGLHGEGGDDYIKGGTGADLMYGGGGSDTVDYSERSDRVQVVLADAVFLGSDGEAGEGDDVRGDVENVYAGVAADTLIGSAASNVLDGGPGGDLIDGKAGADDLVGGTGDDELRSADGTADTADCGEGTDAFEADPLDTVFACETNLAPAPPPSAPSQPPVPGGTSPAPPPSQTSPTTGAAGRTTATLTVLRIGPARVRLTRGGVARLGLTCQAAAGAHCAGTVALRRRARRVARGRFDVAAGTTGTVRVRIPLRARRCIGSRGLRVRAKATLPGAATSRTVKLLKGPTMKRRTLTGVG